ncbi:hypothetical protein BWK63_07535 [Flavobacterium covae]|uniref:ComEC/Rec2 family competence protein n=1 Tax=Flavobacterium covae TaxID=2906076 RepID=A0ABW8PJF9_9FLAO|nr:MULTISPECIES: ComEC/Rec2 family competence protein [Flavobacterium]OWP81087.1 hypothetical protein BWK63_07535 [Flavobacterium covae]POR22283.1 hypothetical protein BWK57_06935 [Flavobacterium columnare]
MKLYQFPLIKSVCWFVIGIILFHFFSFHFPIFFCLWSLLVFISFVFSPISSRNSIIQLGESALISLVFTMSGVLIAMLHQDTFKSNHFTHLKNYDKKSYIKAEVYERLKSTHNKNRYIISIQTINQKKHSGKVILNIGKEKQNDSELVIGSILLIKGVIHPIQSAGNLGQFDYASYLKTKNIYGQLYIKNQDFKKLKENVKSIRYYTARFRDRIIKNLRDNGFPEKELAVLTALIIGQQQEVDDHLIKVYQYAGVIHILSISGLHVGILYLLLDLICTFFLKDRKYNLLKMFCILLGLWTFACIAGLVAPVLRSTVMFSMIAIGASFKKQVNIYNTLAASVLLILIVQPSFLFDIGFQLSYLAVLSIVSMQPIVLRLWNPKNKIVLFFWKLFVVSFVAQIGTLPLSLYYFHQIPGLFFIANLLVIPFLEYIIMPLGVLVVLLAYFNCMFDGIIWSMIKMIQWMNFIIKWIASFEGFVWKEIPFTLDLMFVSYLIIILFFIWIQKPRFKIIMILCGFLLLFQIILLFRNREAYNEEKFVVFHVPKQKIIGTTKKGITMIYTDSLINEGSYLDRVLIDYQVHTFSKIIKTNKKQNVFWISGKKILLIDSDNFILDNVIVDFLVLSNSPKINLERIIAKYKPQMVISDGSNFKTYIKRFENTCLKRKIPFHNTFEKGFYVIE